MGCTGSTNALPPTADGKRPLAKGQNSSSSDRPSPVAFEVPLRDEQDSLIKKYPPKRLQKLDDKENSPPPLTHQLLFEKLAQAEQRRLQILNERIKSAKSLMKPKCSNGRAMNGLTETPRLIDVDA